MRRSLDAREGAPVRLGCEICGLEQFRHFGGVRVEDNLLVTEEGHRLLGPPIPKLISEIEACVG